MKLDAKHGVSVGTNYTTETAGKEITHYIAESVREKLCLCLSAAKFFSLMLDGSTDSGNICGGITTTFFTREQATAHFVCIMNYKHYVGC